MKLDKVQVSPGRWMVIETIEVAMYGPMRLDEADALIAQRREEWLRDLKARGEYVKRLWNIREMG